MAYLGPARSLLDVPKACRPNGCPAPEVNQLIALLDLPGFGFSRNVHVATPMLLKASDMTQLTPSAGKNVSPDCYKMVFYDGSHCVQGTMDVRLVKKLKQHGILQEKGNRVYEFYFFALECFVTIIRCKKLWSPVLVVVDLDVPMFQKVCDSNGNRSKPHIMGEVCRVYNEAVTGMSNKL